MEWTNAKVCELIELYRDRPVLWDCRLKEYKDRNKKQDALQEIADTFGVDKKVVEKKIKNVVCHFLREIKRERDPRLSEANVHIITTLGSAKLEIFFFRVISNANVYYCSTAPSVPRDT
ncbi:hypothetical protein FQA39_LY04221 [Lamprigera yunnana]|nr:hypothetical protein FQA39_LY04221 [Lamprigera yunnana]